MTDIIQGQRFKDIADFIYAPIEKHKDDYDSLKNTLYFKDLKDVNIVYIILCM